MREHLAFLSRSAHICAKLCRLLARYMDLYIEADGYFSRNLVYNEDLKERALAISKEADLVLCRFKNDGYAPFDAYGGIFTRREELVEFVSYSAGQIVKSLDTDKRIPDDRRAPKIRTWW